MKYDSIPICPSSNLKLSIFVLIKSNRIALLNFFPKSLAIDLMYVPEEHLIVRFKIKYSFSSKKVVKILLSVYSNNKNMVS